MAEGQLSYIQKKARRLSTCLSDVEQRLRSEYEHTWGEEQTLQKQNLLRRKAFLEERLEELEQAAQKAYTQDRDSKAQFTIQIGGRTREVMIVSSHYAAPNEGYISSESPLAQALKCISVGETFNMDTPRGKQDLKLLSVN